MVVVDASVIVALVVPDPLQAEVQDLLAAWLEEGAALHAPAVLPFETANVLARLVFEGSLERRQVTEIWHDLAALSMILHPFDLTRDGPEVAAITTRLRRRHATDSTYLCLARRLEAPLWTLDGALARNASDIGLPVNLIS